MKRSRLCRFVLIPLLPVLLVAPATWAQEQRADDAPATPTLDAATITQINRIFAHFGNATPGAAMAIVRDGSIVYNAGYGMANLEYDIPITPASTFHVASVSKQFTAMAVVLLALDGKLRLDADIREYIPEVPDFGPTITIRHLLNHTSGLRDQWNLLGLAGWRANDVKTQDDILDLVSRQRALNFEPGAEYLYCNTGFTLLAILVSRVSGQPMKEFARERIFEPLGMMDTHFHDDIGHIVKNRTYAYSRREGGFRINIPDFENYGATSLFTNVGDLARWADNFEHNKVGGDAGIRMLLTRGMLNEGEEISYALGIQHGQYRGLRTVGHGGSDAGYRSAFTTYPDQRTAIIVLSNVSNGDPGGLARQIAEVLLADDFTEEAPEPRRPERRERMFPELSEEQLAQYAGIYYSVELDVRYEIAPRDGSLVLMRRKFSDRELTASGEDLFEAGNRLQFTRDATGRVDGFDLSTGRVRNLRFEKVDQPVADTLVAPVRTGSDAGCLCG